MPEVFGKVDLESSRSLSRATTIRIRGRSSTTTSRRRPRPKSKGREAALTTAKDDALKLAQKKLAAAKAALPALEARIAAERAKYATPPPLDLDKLAVDGAQLERKANVLKAEAQTARRRTMAARSRRERRSKKTAKAKKTLEEAVAALGRGEQRLHADRSRAIREPAPAAALPWPTGSTSRDNPLTARVAVNHIWLRHFGQALVPTVFDFGLNGKPPTHPELLDWLAAEFMDRDWSMKAIHRLIVTSSAYRMRSSGWDAEDTERQLDPDNQYLWRMNARRMEAEVVRDSRAAGRRQARPDDGRPGPRLKQGLANLPAQPLLPARAGEADEFLRSSTPPT